MTNPIAEAKEKLALPGLMHELGLGDHAKKSALCPFHDDQEKSFSIYKNDKGWRFKCFAGCGGGDEIDFLQLAEDLSKKEAVKRFLKLAGVNGTAPLAPRPNKQTNEFEWDACVEAFTDKHLEQLAEWRGFSGEFCSWLHKERLLGLHEGCIAFPVHKGSHIVGCHVRPKNSDKWFHFPNGTNAAPLIFGEIQQGDTLHCFESTWDGLDFMDVSGERTDVVITRGSANAKFVIETAAKASTLYLWTQNDEPGASWEKAILERTECTVMRVKIPLPHKDLNDWTRSGASCKDLLDAMVNAETIRVTEKTWTEALSEAVVTSTELRNLKITPRKKLLGDWLCEGDLGFIFAFRGVGKTWFALAIAQAIASAGNLGDWQAHEKVKVLYVDGEMPPDLMRDRCGGLQGDENPLELINHEILFDRTGKVLNIANREVQLAITEHCANTSVKVLVLDNLSTLASGMRENEADSWELVNNWLLDLRRRKIAVIIVHHAGRSGEMRGTSKREDNVFWIIALDDAKENAEDKRGARFISRFTKPSRNTQEEVATYEWHFITEPNGEVSVSHKLAETMDVFLGLVGDGAATSI